MDERDQQLIALLDKIISQLSQPLTPDEQQYRWTDEAKRAWIGVMQKFLDKLNTGQAKENMEEEINLTYGLAYEGKEHGPLAEMITEFDIQWNMKYSREKRKWWYHRKKKEFK